MTNIISPVTTKDIGYHPEAKCVKFSDDFPDIPFSVVLWSSDKMTVTISVSVDQEVLNSILNTDGYSEL